MPPWGTSVFVAAMSEKVEPERILWLSSMLEVEIFSLNNKPSCHT